MDDTSTSSSSSSSDYGQSYRLIDNEGRSAANPMFRHQVKMTVPGQRTSRFTVQNRRENPVQDDEDQAYYKLVPSSDHPIKIMPRKNPLVLHSQRAKIQSEIDGDLDNLLQLETFYSNTNCGVKYLFLVDGIMTELKMGIFKNLRFMQMGCPRVPQFFLEALERWWTESVQQTDSAPFYFDKIFICLGMEMTIFYSGDLANQEEIVDLTPAEQMVDFLIRLNKWFELKLDEVRNSYEAAGEQSRHLLKLDRPGIDEGGRQISLESRRSRLAQKPVLVLITIPECGHYSSVFVDFNNTIRNFVAKNPQDFLLLDWADILAKKPLDERDTVEKRMRILIEEIHLEHGVLYD